MKWTELQKTNDLLNDAKDYIIEQMKQQYHYETKDNAIIFSLPDNVFMKVFSMHGEHFNCLGMEYGSTPDLLPEDGDLYYIADYDTPEQLFYAMLAEIKR